jgi:hypothetical protein
MPAGLALYALKASGIGGLSGLVASVAFSAFRRLNRFGAILSGFVTMTCYIGCFNILFKGQIDASLLFFVFNLIYGVAVGLFIFWPLHQVSLRRPDSQQPAEEAASGHDDEDD